MKEESEKVGLKLNIQKTKIVASSPVTSWQIDGETMKTVIDFIFKGSKITADGGCSYEILKKNINNKNKQNKTKNICSLGKKSFDRPRQHIKKQRHYFANKGPFSQSYGFSSSHVWIWELDYKKAECQRIDAFEL